MKFSEVEDKIRGMTSENQDKIKQTIGLIYEQRRHLRTSDIIKAATAKGATKLDFVMAYSMFMASDIVALLMLEKDERTRNILTLAALESFMSTFKNHVENLDSIIKTAQDIEDD